MRLAFVVAAIVILAALPQFASQYLSLIHI